ncbi:uncharacterized protein BYT42DRAFT_267402 [Radiomyces spectabilis]|uniref:uncharacterized protein n=1 Tax=Radiomyces spectabilis TaxID=64574 RepID=UPI0022201DAE|nr:uncharacterized protein BYT42DRAFT_267402 [Radiomyces spectabilis]KAI8384603.1 hypothetical protein BYT42DRAFT_267402 [Radiomyces spectabilis]
MPDPMPSMSTPVQMTPTLSLTTQRSRRRHTITRPDSALALLSNSTADSTDDEAEDDCSEMDQQQRFDRISDILSNLIQEANEAVNNNTPKERSSMMTRPFRYSAPPITAPALRRSTSIVTSSKLPRPKHSRASHTPVIVHARDSSLSCTSSCSSPTALFSPPHTIPSSSSSTATSPTPASPVKKTYFRHMNGRPLSCPAPIRRSKTPRSVKRSMVQVQSPLLESFKQLDSSIALVDSLSRDLVLDATANHPTHPFSPSPPSQRSMDSRFSALFLLPLLHIPHALISIAFSAIPNHTTAVAAVTPSGSPSNFTGMIAWAFFFALANVMVDRVVTTTTRTAPVRWISSKVRRLSLPGTFMDRPTHINTNLNTTTPNLTEVMPSPLPLIIQRRSITSRRYGKSVMTRKRAPSHYTSQPDFSLPLTIATKHDDHISSQRPILTRRNSY